MRDLERLSVALDEAERELLQTQMEYYEARADEYDETAYSMPSDATRIERAIARLAPGGDILEIACGTGVWSKHLIEAGESLTAVDSSPAAVSLARAKCGPGACFEIGDVFSWSPGARKFDTVFMAFWMSHVPRRLWDAFLGWTASILRAGGRVLIVDEHPRRRTSERWISAWPDTARRTLNDGSIHEIVKVHADPRELRVVFRSLGWPHSISAEDDWVLGIAKPRSGGGRLAIWDPFGLCHYVNTDGPER